jgi:hypothetical protein
MKNWKGDGKEQLWPYLEISSAVSDRDEGQTRKT